MNKTKIDCENCGHLPDALPATKKCVHCDAMYCEECFKELSLNESGDDNGGCVNCGKSVNQ